MLIDKKGKGISFRLFQGVLPVNRARLMPDILAGITLAALGIPEVMGYTKIINLPVVTGLYSFLLPMYAFAIFGSSKHLVVSADSATAAIVAASLIALSISPASPDYIRSARMIALLTGCMLLLARIFKVGFIADFLSRTVLIGFLTGVGIQVAFGEIHHMLGITSDGHHFIRQLISTIQHLAETQKTSLVISLITIAIIVTLEKIVPKFPGALLVLTGMLIASATFQWSNHGVEVIGEVPGGMPDLSLPKVSWKELLNLLPISFSCFIVIIAQSAATSRAYAIRFHDEFSEDRDLIGLALANFTAAFSNSFIVNGSPTKTAMVESAGGKSQISQITAATIVLFVLLFFTRPLSFLPGAVLASIVFLIGLKLVDLKGMSLIRKEKPKEFLLALTTAATVVLVGVEQGILLAILLSILQHIRKSYRPFSGIILHDSNEQWKFEKLAPDKFIETGLVMYWFGAELFYANANHFETEVRTLINQDKIKPRWLAIDASALTSVDFSAGLMLRDLIQELKKKNITLVFTRVDQSLRSDLDQLGITEQIGEAHLFLSRSSCIEAFRKFSSG